MAEVQRVSASYVNRRRNCKVLYQCRSRGGKYPLAAEAKTLRDCDQFSCAFRYKLRRKIKLASRCRTRKNMREKLFRENPSLNTDENYHYMHYIIRAFDMDRRTVSLALALLNSVMPLKCMKILSKLTTDSTWHSQAGVNISVECRWVVFDLLDIEASTCVGSGTSGVDSSSERPLDAANAVGILLISDWVGKCDSWWARKTLGRLMNVCSSQSG